MNEGYQLSILSRSEKKSTHENVKFYLWNIEEEKIDLDAFLDVDTIINLTGANIGEKRWTKKRKKEIIDSRVKSVQLLYKYVTENQFKISTYISSSAVGFYGAITLFDEILDENSPNGNDFLGSVCQKWENESYKFSEINTRVVILRKGVILGNGGMYKRLVPLSKLGVNTALGSGKQFLPWIDIDDLVELYLFLIQHQEVSGVFNVVADENVTMNEFSLKMLASFEKKSFLPNLPSFLLKVFLGEMSKMILEGTRVSNEKLKKTGFSFRFSQLSDSLSKLASKE